MKTFLRYLRMSKPFLTMAAEMLEDSDEDTTGVDDQAAQAIKYSAEVVDAVSKGRPIPYPSALIASFEKPAQ